MSKDFNSLFVPKLEIDVSNFITENIIFNKINWLVRKGNKINKPNFAFWRKDMLEKNPQFKQLAQDYTNELTYMRKLMYCFSSSVILAYVKERGIITFVYHKLDQQKQVIYNLWQREIKLRKQLNKKKLKKIDTVIYSPRSTMKNKISDLL